MRIPVTEELVPRAQGRRRSKICKELNIPRWAYSSAG